MLKNKKGITLVALVVTIVVLLILAGVSINLVLGNNGIIAKAKEAETKSAEASQNDLKGINALTEEMNNALGEGNSKYPLLYAGQKGAGVNVAEANASTIAQPDISKGNDPYEESKAIATTEPTTDNTSETGNPLTVTQTYYSIPISPANYGDAASVLSNSKWVAARYVDIDSGCARFGLHIIVDIYYFLLLYMSSLFHIFFQNCYWYMHFLLLFLLLLSAFPCLIDLYYVHLLLSSYYYIALYRFHSLSMVHCYILIYY